ncbi:hypothetical protein VQL36_02610 [Chengkuizengella sp. SCS-71B]|uniref:hypothetical protein n=1 Tax=Chengkuizengella sp. SCS-71B TaxID=3115290 RepID=UPI0032C24298
MSAYGRRSGSGAAIVLVLFILLVIILVAASGGSRYTTPLPNPINVQPNIVLGDENFTL